MDKVWWTAIAGFGIADVFFAWCSYDLLRVKWYFPIPGSGFLGCFWLLRRAWIERHCHNATILFCDEPNAKHARAHNDNMLWYDEAFKQRLDSNREQGKSNMSELLNYIKEQPLPDINQRALSEALYSMSERRQWPDAVDSMSTEHALLVWRVVERVRKDGFPDSLRM